MTHDERLAATRLARLERAVIIAGRILARDSVWELRGKAFSDTEGVAIAELLPSDHPIRERYNFYGF